MPTAVRRTIGVLLLLCACAPAYAQFETASIVGTVRDTTGAVVPAATVSLTSTATGVALTRTSAADGSFEFFTVKDGVYVHDDLGHAGDIRLHAGCIVRRFGHSAGFPRRQQLPAEDHVRSGEREPDHHRLLQRFMCCHPDRPEPAVRKRDTQLGARSIVLAGGPGAQQAGVGGIELQSRDPARAFNLFNRTNFRAPNGNKSSGGFGTITSTYDARQLQIGAKFLW